MEALETAVNAALLALQHAEGGTGPVLEAAFEDVVTAGRDGVLVSRLSGAEPALRELAHRSGLLLSRPSTPTALAARLHAFLNHFAEHNRGFRHYCAAELGMAGSAYECLRASLRSQAGPEHLLQNLRLLQIITYDCGVVLGPSWVPDFLNFLVKEIVRDTKSKDADWLPFCLGILHNVVAAFPQHKAWIRAHECCGQLEKRLMGLLASQSRGVVIYSLALIAGLSERLLETVFSKKNLNQTVPCIINVLIKGDGFLARPAAVDLLLSLSLSTGAGGVADVVRGESVGRASRIGLDLVSFPGLARALGPVAACLVHLADQAEQIEKILDLFLAFSNIEELRKPGIAAILNADPVKSRGLKTPLVALIDLAIPELSDAANTAVPLKAQRLLRISLEEMIEVGQRVPDYVSPEPLVELVQTTVKTPLDTGSKAAAAQSTRVLEGLRLAKAMSGDDDLRSYVLDVVSGSLCGHVSQFQLLSNPIAIASDASNLPEKEWAVVGVWVMVELLQLLATLKDHSGPHKQQYWRLLKDERLLPLLAFGVSSGRQPLVQGALTLILHCAQNHQFNHAHLSSLIARCTTRGVSKVSSSQPTPPPATNGHGHGHTLSQAQSAELDSVLAKLRKGGSASSGGGGDCPTSELVTLYEARLSAAAAREREKDVLLASKEELLGQTERLLATASAQRAECDSEAAALRRLLQKGAASSETGAAHIARLEEQQRESRVSLAKAENRCESLEEVVASLKAEQAAEEEMSAKFRQNYKDMKAKFETASREVMEQKTELARREVEANAERQAHKSALHERQAETRRLSELLVERSEALELAKAEVADREKRIRALDAELKETRDIVHSISKLTTGR